MNDEWNEYVKLRDKVWAELEADGIDLSNTYTDQEGCVWYMTGATCPRCSAPSKLSTRTKESGYFNCPSCDVMYDEPNFDPDDLITVIGENE